MLVERHLAALAVDFGRAGQQNAAVVTQRRLEHLFGAHDVGFDRAPGVLDDELHADRRRQMHDDVGFRRHLLEHHFAGVLARANLKCGWSTREAMLSREPVDRSSINSTGSSFFKRASARSAPALSSTPGPRLTRGFPQLAADHVGSAR